LLAYKNNALVESAVSSRMQGNLKQITERTNEELRKCREEYDEVLALETKQLEADANAALIEEEPEDQEEAKAD
jgi:hypothetical protein